MLLDTDIHIDESIVDRKDLQYQTFLSIHYDQYRNKIFFQLSKFEPKFDGSIRKINHWLVISPKCFHYEHISPAELFATLEENLIISMKRIPRLTF